MKLEVGQFIRYKYENCIYIGKIKFISEVMCGLNETLQIDIDNCMEEILKKDILKASNSIIDLIEVGDYVNGYEVEYKFEYSLRIQSGQDYWYMRNDDIKTIITKEQFSQMEYKVD